VLSSDFTRENAMLHEGHESRDYQIHNLVSCWEDVEERFSGARDDSELWSAETGDGDRLCLINAEKLVAAEGHC
jgi:hypothetical protein